MTNRSRETQGDPAHVQPRTTRPFNMLLALVAVTLLVGLTLVGLGRDEAAAMAQSSRR